MLELLRRSHRYFIGGVIFIIGGVFVAYLGIGGAGKGSSGPSTGAIVQVGSRHYSIADLQRVREDQERSLRESLGDAFDAKAASQYLDQISADRLIQRAVLASEAERAGLRASDEEVKALVRRAFGGPDGLDGAALRDYAVRRFGSEGRFVQEVRDDILFTKLLDLIDAGADVSDAEARDSVRTRLEEIRVATVALDVEKPPPGVEPDDEAVEKVLRDENERVRRFYDEHPDRYHLPERVRARHVLIRIEPGADDAAIAAAQQRADAALARIQGGEDFEKVASDVSEDPGSKDRGGDLGLFPRGQMVPAFEEVAFSQKDGETSAVVRTDFGFHVIRTEAHEAAQNRSFDEAAREIAEELAGADRARALARETSDRLVEAVRGGKSLEDAAREASVPTKTSEWVRRRRDGYLPDVGAAPQVVTAAFAASPDKPSLDRVFDVGSKLVMVQVIERRGPTDDEVAAEVPAERTKLLEARRNELRGTWLKESRARLTREGELVVDLTPLQGAS
jgi:peptidyl-prolyl cis-trans isomerase D